MWRSRRAVLVVRTAGSAVGRLFAAVGGPGRTWDRSCASDGTAGLYITRYTRIIVHPTETQTASATPDRPANRFKSMLLAAALLAVLTLTAAACASHTTKTGTPSPAFGGGIPTPTSVVFPTAAASADQPIWDFVRHWQGADVSPILRPSFLPPGLDSVTIGQPPTKHDTSLLDVEYTGGGKRLAILAGALNPSSEGTPPTQVTVRGVPATLATGTNVDGGSYISLWWHEPGEQIIQNGQPLAHLLYEVYAEGLTPQDVLDVAASLTP